MDAAAKPLFNWEETRSETDDSQAVRAGSGRRADGPAGGAGPAAEPFGGQIAVPEQLYSGESAMLTLNTGDDFTGTKRVTLTADNAPDCVDEGLVLHWDGVCNTKSGHDAAATVWEDLSGNGADLALSELSGDNYWTGEGFHLKNTAYSTPQCLQDTINGSAFTLEMVVDDYILYGNSFGTLLSSENDSFSVFHRASNGIWEFKNGNNQNRPKLNDAAALLQGSTVSIVFTAGAESTVYVNGEAARQLDPRRRHRRLRLDAPGPRRRHPEVRGGLSFRPPV